MEKKSILEAFDEIEEKVDELKELMGICSECSDSKEITIQTAVDSFEKKRCPECSLDVDDEHDGLDNK